MILGRSGLMWVCCATWVTAIGWTAKSLLVTLSVEGATVASVAQGKVTSASDGYVNIDWADYPTEFDVPITPKEEAETTYQLPLSRFTSSAAELTGMGATVSGDTVSLSPQLAT